jgi:hypothetical protein
MVREYPTSKASKAPATGRLFYEFLLRNIKIPASAAHVLWYNGAKAQLERPDIYAFRGDIPIGKTINLQWLAGNPICDGGGYVQYTFNGTEEYVLVSDLSNPAMRELGIPGTARAKDKVYNSNFKPYEKLPELTKISNELAPLSVAKSISSYLCGVKGRMNYSEHDVLNFLTACLRDLSGVEMSYLLHGNHLAWTVLAYIRSKGSVEGDILAEFYGQNPTDFFVKDLGTILPTIFFVAASFGDDPVEYFKMLDIEIWGAKEVAEYMRAYRREDVGSI